MEFHTLTACRAISASAELRFSSMLIKLEYLAVYGRASMAAFRQLSTHGQKFDPGFLYEPM